MGKSPQDDHSIEQLKEQYEKLNERKIETKTELKRAEEDLATLQKDADQEFGTHDVAELREKLNTMEAENKKNRLEYQKLLDKIETDLAKVEKENKQPTASESATND
jgi:septal ring factor EnvC (AmiA/AmiB activator)